MTDFGRKLETFLKAAGLGLRELGRLLDVNKSTPGHWKKRLDPPPSWERHQERLEEYFPKLADLVPKADDWPPTGRGAGQSATPTGTSSETDLQAQQPKLDATFWADLHRLLVDLETADFASGKGKLLAYAQDIDLVRLYDGQARSEIVCRLLHDSAPTVENWRFKNLTPIQELADRLERILESATSGSSGASSFWATSLNAHIADMARWRIHILKAIQSRTEEMEEAVSILAVVESWGTNSKGFQILDALNHEATHYPSFGACVRRHAAKWATMCVNDPEFWDFSEVWTGFLDEAKRDHSGPSILELHVLTIEEAKSFLRCYWPAWPADSVSPVEEFEEMAVF